MTTWDGWWAIARSIRWPALLVPVLLGGALLAAARVVAGPDRGLLALVGATSRLLVCACVAFVVDDPATSASPAAVVTARHRLVGRAVLGLPVVILGWLALVGLERWWSESDAAVGASGSVALGALAIGGAAVAWHHGVGPSPGAAGAAGTVVLAIVASLVPAAWMTHAPDSTLLTATACALGAAAVWSASAEPAP